MNPLCRKIENWHLKRVNVINFGLPAASNKKYPFYICYEYEQGTLIFKSLLAKSCVEIFKGRKRFFTSQLFVIQNRWMRAFIVILTQACA